MMEPKTPLMSPAGESYQQPRLSMSAVRRRLSSAAVVMSTGNNQDAVLEATRQRFEDKKRRISIVSPKVLRPEKPSAATENVQPIGSAPKSSFDLLSPDDATEHYRQCLRLAIENKINKKNAFDLKLIENLETILSGKNRQNFALCASLVDVGTRIFGSRVDANDIELKRICTWLCGGASKDDENEEDGDDEIKKADRDGNYGGNDSVLAEVKAEEKKKSKSQSRKAVIEEDNNKLSAPIEKRSKANPLMKGRRSALAAGGISEGLASVLLLPSLAVTERPLNKNGTILNYVVSEAADRQFSSWIRNVHLLPPTVPQRSEIPRWSFDKLQSLDFSKEICPPLHAIDLNKTFGNELEGIGDSTSAVDDVSCEEALHSKTHLVTDSVNGDLTDFGEENIRILPSQEINGVGNDDSFEMPGLEDQSLVHDNGDGGGPSQDMMLLVPMDDNTASQSALPLASASQFSIDQLHEILAKTLTVGDNFSQESGSTVPPSWLMEQLVNGTVGKALKMRQKPSPSDEKLGTTKPRRNVVKVQKVQFSEEIFKQAEVALSKKSLPKSTRKQTMSAITGENDLPEPVINQEFDNLLKKLRDCFIMGGARSARAASTEGMRDGSLNAGALTQSRHDDDDDDDDDYDNYADAHDNIGPLDLDPMFGAADLEGVNKSFSRHESILLQRNLADNENPAVNDEVTASDEQNRISGQAIGQMLLHHVRNAQTSLAASLMLRRVDVRIAKQELWRAVEKHAAPEANFSVVVSGANDNLVAASNSQTSAPTPKATPSTLSPQMAFVCLLHLANEHNLKLRNSGETFTDINVETQSTV